MLTARRLVVVAAVLGCVVSVLLGARGSRVLADSWVRYEAESGTPVTLGGATSQTANASASNGNYVGLDASGEYAEVLCPANTTGVRVISSKMSNSGIANVTLDGSSAGTSDQYNVTTLWQQVTFEQTGLAAGTHTLRATYSGTKNAASSSTVVRVDAFECYVTTPATTTTSTTVAPTTTTTVAPTTTTTVGKCAWEWGGTAEPNPQPCHDSDDAGYVGTVGTILSVFALFALVIVSWRN